MPLWSCQWDNCVEPAAQRAGDCLLCDRHLCRTHLKKPWHECPSPEDDWESYSTLYSAAEARHIDELCRRINYPKLCSLASALRGNILCTVELSRKSLSAMMGNQNCHAEITFQDNAKWLARFRLVRTTSPPKEVRDYILRSEAATLMYLQQHTSIPVPKVFHWACESDPRNELGVGYILMEKLDGKPLEWQSTNSTQKEKIMQQLVDIFLEVEKNPLDAMGSLVCSAENTSDFHIKGLAQSTTFQFANKSPIGPFSSSLEGTRAILKSYLAIIASGEIDAYDPVDIYLVHGLRLEIVDSLWKDFPSSNGRFFLKHPDDKGDHILVNDNFDIVGIIDWEWAYTVSKAEAFCSPCMMWPVGEFYEGNNALDQDELRLAEIFREKGREDLAKCVTQGRKVQRFFFALSTETTFLDRSTFTSLFRA